MNKTKLIKLSTLLLFLLLFFSCNNPLIVSGKGNVVTENISVSDFNSIELNTSAQVEISKGIKFKIEVSDYENIIEYLKVKVVSHKLIIYSYPLSTTILNSNAIISITLPDSLLSIGITGSGDMILNSAFKDINTLYISGTGDIKATNDLNISSLEATITGSGNMTFSGNVKTLIMGISGDGKMLFSQLIAENVDCSITGNGNMYLNVTNNLNALISGVGIIEYTGNPIVKKEITGTGTIIKK